MMPSHAVDPDLALPGFRWSDLHRRDRLVDLLIAFEEDLLRTDAALAESYCALRDGRTPPGPGASEALIALAPHVASFLTRLFGVESEYGALRNHLQADAPILRFRRHFLKKVLPGIRPEDVGGRDPEGEAEPLIREIVPEQGGDPELRFARAVVALLDREEELVRRSRSGVGGTEAALRSVRASLELLNRRAAWLHSFAPEGRAWVSLRAPESLDYQHLVRRRHPDPDLPELSIGPPELLRRRDGFCLTDPRMNDRQVLAETEYCVLCHPREKDSCSKGLREKTGEPRRNPLGIPLSGCPLEEKISEMHALRREGDCLAALVLVMIDNPMCPGTGHRICNDCMKACIYQKQEPVNIPQVETGVLAEVLKIPYGAEIYLLLTRWNPLNFRRPVPAPFNGKKVLVVGLGPAGYTLSHYLLNDGFGVVAIDGLKLEPMPDPGPVSDFQALYKNLDERVLAGFGGVSEYGITVRWDKNFLTLIRLALSRRDTFRAYGGVRFGGTLTLEDCWAMGFDHVAIAAGAGRPTLVEMKGGLSRGIRQASDFLMALQLTGAFKRESLANLQVRLPAVVIGGGLTAIDTATELIAYYPVQVEKILERHTTLAARFGEADLRERCDPEEREILDELLAHGRAVRAERERARAAGEEPDLLSLVQSWGGVTIAYRRSLQESPAYRLNHEEVIHCLEEGVRFAERLNPLEAICDEHGAVREVVFARMESVDGRPQPGGGTVRLPARSVCVAAGTSPNVIYEREHPGTFELDERGRYFAAHVIVRDEEGTPRLRPARPGETGFFTSYEKEGHFVSYYGDNHPVYAGNVVKAMASARRGYLRIVELFEPEISAAGPQPVEPFLATLSALDHGLRAEVVRVERLTPTIVDVVVRSPLASRKFHPGQFYRLQNYETDSPVVGETRLSMEGIALTGAWVDPAAGLLSLIVLEMGASSRLCAALRPGQRVVVMGPTGSPTEIPRGEKVLLAGGGLGNAVLFSIARAMREAGNRVLYFAGYRSGTDLFKREEIEAATDQVIWSTERGEAIRPRRPQDRHFRGNIVEAMLAHAQGALDPVAFPLREVNRILAIGSDRMMAAVKGARQGVLRPYLGPHMAIGSINSSMQCMLKEVCAQCLQQHLDPQTGRPSGAVFTCFCQDQILDEVDFGNLSDRLRMNSLQEKITNRWLDVLLEKVERV